MFKFCIIWDTRKIKTLFPLKDKLSHHISVIYEGVCDCGANYIGETDRNDVLRIAEHEDVRLTSEPAKHLASNANHAFSWKVIRNAPHKRAHREIIEAFFVYSLKPSLNTKTRKLTLFHSGIT